MNRVPVYSIVFAMLAYSVSWSTIINIPADYPTIQQGINVSVDGDTVLVQPGTYMENINFNGHNIVVGSLFLITGDTSSISRTIIDGDYDDVVVTFANDESDQIPPAFQQGGDHFFPGSHCQHDYHRS